MTILNSKICSTISIGSPPKQVWKIPITNIYQQSENILTDDLAGGRSLQQTLWVMVSCASSCCSWVQAV